MSDHHGHNHAHGHVHTNNKRVLLISFIIIGLFMIFFSAYIKANNATPSETVSLNMCSPSDRSAKLLAKKPPIISIIINKPIIIKLV